MVEPKAAAQNEWFFQKVFGDGDFIAAGQLIIPPKGQKPSKGTKDNTYVSPSLNMTFYLESPLNVQQVFYVIEGAVNLKVHETSMILATGGMFMVPRGDYTYLLYLSSTDTRLNTGNTYLIENIADRDAKLFFTQARKIAAEEDAEDARAYMQPLPGRRLSADSIRRTSGGGRSSSMGAAPTATATARTNGSKTAQTAKRAASTKI